MSERGDDLLAVIAAELGYIGAQLRELIEAQRASRPAPPAKVKCSGVTETCPVDECPECGARDCPYGSEDHYWKDGCPTCWSVEQRVDMHDKKCPARLLILSEGTPSPERIHSYCTCAASEKKR